MNQKFQVERDVLDDMAISPPRINAAKRERLALRLATDRACSIDAEAGDVEVEDGAEKEFVRELDSLVKHVQALIKSTAVMFDVVTVSKHRYEVRALPMGNVMLKKMQIAPLIEDHFTHHRLDPRFKLFKECVAMVPQADSLHLRMTFTKKEEALARAKELNAIVVHTRTRGRSNKFIASCKNFHRSSDKNYRELLRYVKKHSELIGRLLICRCDVGVKKAAKFQLTSRMQQLRVLSKARKALFEYIKTKFGGPYLGFAWKLEFGLQRGFHLHLMFIFNGRDLKSDIPIVRMIGEYWKNEIMGGDGTYYNCNAFKGSYKECGIGQYSKNIDSAKWKGIELMCAYLTKPDDLVRLHFKGMRTFAKGNFPKDKEKKSKTMAELAAGG